MTKYRTPFNPKYCKEVNCPNRYGSKCKEDCCVRTGGVKWATYWTTHGKLADGDKIDA